MKYCVLIMDGAAGLPLRQHGGRTCLELAQTPNLDAMARESTLGLVRTVPLGMEPSSACACMSVMGYDPQVYYRGRAAIEAKSMGISVDRGDAVFRCNLVAIRDGKMWDYSTGHIPTSEARQLIAALDTSLGTDGIHFYPGVSYRHICHFKGRKNILLANCTPPHDIPGQPVDEYLPTGPGSRLLRDLMKRSEAVLRDHPVNVARRARGDIPATSIWLFWGSGPLPHVPPFTEAYGLRAAMTSGVDLLRGLAQMASMTVLEIPGVTDGLDNDYQAQVSGAREALQTHDLVVVHIEAPDECGHAGSVRDKVSSIESIDKEVVARLRSWSGDALRVLVMPDHPTPIEVQTHTAEPVPFMLWGVGFTANRSQRFTENEAKSTGFFIEEGYKIMSRLIST